MFKIYQTKNYLLRQVNLNDAQDMFEYYRIANNQEMKANITEYYVIDRLWRDAVREYAQGLKSREEAIAGFKAAVKDKFPEFS